VGFAYVSGDDGRMNFVRFSGELAIYYVLIALGGFVVTLFTFVIAKVAVAPKAESRVLGR
jgi:hypothetical protein